MKNYIKTEELKEYIYKKGMLADEPMITEWKFNIYFEKVNANKLPGKYIYSDNKGYYNADVGDRGGIVYKRCYQDIDELTFDLYKFIVWLCAINYFDQCRYNGVDNRESMDDYQLELMKKIDDNYYKRLLDAMDQ